jgi:hypothetical protein
VDPTVTLSFTANEANQSTATATPQSGATSSTITVTLRGPTDLPLTGHTVTLVTGSSTATVQRLAQTTAQARAGQVQFKVTDRVAQTLSITVTDGTARPVVQLYQPVVVSVT